MRNQLPTKYTCPKCDKTSSSKGYFCSFCGNKKEKPDSQFIEYDFDLFPQRHTANSSPHNQTSAYIRKVVISFGLVIFMGLSFYLPYTITKSLTKHKKPEVFEINITPENKFKIVNLQNISNLKSTSLNSTRNAEFIENSFDIYYESNQLYNINEYFEKQAPNLTNLATKMSVNTIVSQTEENISFAIKDDEYIIVIKFKNREFAYSLEKILAETDYKTKVIDDYLILSNSSNYLDRNLESYKGSVKNLAKSGYFLDTLQALPKNGQVFIFIKTARGLKHFEQTLKTSIPTTRLPIGIIIDNDKLYYIDFTF